VAVTRARWLTGAVIGAAALIVAGEALATYVAERLVVGIVAVVVLMAVLAIGFASLARARRYIAGELAALGAEPPSGALYEARRAQLSALRGRGVSPDLDLLADATAAAEAERGYTGKYLVATTVLIGLVGTFGGLMETLGRVAPLLKGDLGSGGGGPGAAFALIAGPLAGLHVTFGTSVVAILVTLALSLVQGDVTLQHERLLALLQERTRHVLVPELWPADDSAAERTVRALLELRAFVAESLTTGSAKSAEKIAGVVRVEVQRLVAQIGAETQAATAAQTAALERTGAALTDGFHRTTEVAAQALRDAATTTSDGFQRTTEVAAQALREAATTTSDGFQRTTEVAAQALREAATTSRDTMTAAAAASREAVATAASAAGEAVASAATASRAAFAAAAAEAREQVAAALETLASTTARASESISASTAIALETLASTTAAAAAETREQVATALETLASTTARASESVSTSTAAAVTSFGELRGSLSAELQGASQALATAAVELRGAVGALSPALGELAPQLRALTAEVGLLAARADSPELPNAVLDELVRLAEDVERLLASSSTEPSDGFRTSRDGLGPAKLDLPRRESSQPPLAATATATTEVPTIEVAHEAES
jgi:hypothetical protein